MVKIYFDELYPSHSDAETERIASTVGDGESVTTSNALMVYGLRARCKMGGFELSLRFKGNWYVFDKDMRAKLPEEFDCLMDKYLNILL